VPFYWFLIDDRPGQVEPQKISIRQLRDLAQSVPGLAPTAISYETIAWRYVLRTMLGAGLGVRQIRFSVNAYRLAIPNGQSIMIDSGLSAASAQELGLGHYDAHAQARVNTELKKVKLVFTLGEDVLHSGGIQLAGLARPARDLDERAGCPGRGRSPRASSKSPSVTNYWRREWSMSG